MSSDGHTAPSGGALITAYLDAVSQKDETAIDRYFHPDVEYVVNGAVTPDPASGVPPISPDLERVFPWFGVHRGKDAVKVFLARLHQNLEVTAYGPRTVVSDGDKAAVFGWFRLHALSTGRTIDIGYAVFAEVQDGLIVKYRFVENTYAVADAFRTSGVWALATDSIINTLPHSN